jgi:type IV secretory pathway TrbD component
VTRRSIVTGGIAFPVLFVAAVLVYGSGAGKTAPEIAAYYDVQSNALRQIAGFAVMLVAIVALLVFVSGLRGSLGMLAGGAAALLLASANALWAATAFATQLESGYPVSASSHLLVEDAGFACFVSAMVFAAVLVTATSLSGVLPRALAVAGAPVAVALLASYWYLPAFAFLAWTVAVGIAALRARNDPLYL